MNAIIAHFGLPAVFVGSGVEGEPFAVAGGLLAHRRVVSLWMAILAAIAGSFAVDQFWFLLGRRFRSHRWVRAATKRPAFARSLRLIERHSRLAIILFRFAYGLRAVAPVAVGASDLPARDFVLLDLVAATIWGTSFTLLGYAFGRAVGRWAGDLVGVGVVIGVVLLVVSVLKIKTADSRAARDER